MNIYIILLIEFQSSIRNQNHHDNHHHKNSNSIITFSSKFNNIGIDIFLINKIVMQMSNIYSNLMNQYNFEISITLFSIIQKNWK